MRHRQLEASAAELDQFNKNIRDCQSGKQLPQFSEADFPVLDAKMNDVHRHVLATPVTQVSYLGTIRKAGVEETQHGWLA
jgi:hypothetical protein